MVANKNDTVILTSIDSDLTDLIIKEKIVLLPAVNILGLIFTPFIHHEAAFNVTFLSFLSLERKDQI